MTDHNLPSLRLGIGSSLIALQSEAPNGISENDGENWLCFPGTHSDANFSLLQTGDLNKFASQTKKQVDMRIEHFVFVTGASQKLETASILEEEFARDDDLPFMGYDLVKDGEKLVDDPRVRKGTVVDREEVAKLLAECFHTTIDCQRSFARASGHASREVAMFVVREALAESEGALLATAAVAVVGKVAGVWSVSVSPRARRQGLARAVLSKALLFARNDCGAEMAVLLASEEGKPMYEQKLGWKVLETWQLYMTRNSDYRIPASGGNSPRGSGGSVIAKIEENGKIGGNGAKALTPTPTPSFSQPVHNPSLRLQHGLAVIEMVKDCPDCWKLESDGENWMVMVPGGSYALIQSGHPTAAAAWKQKILDVEAAGTSETTLFLVGNARKFLRETIFGEFPDDPESSMISFAYDLTQQGAHLQYDPRIRLSTAADRKDITNLYIEAFGEDPTEISPHSYVAGHQNPDILTFVMEFDGVVLATLTSAITENIVHMWSIAVSQQKRRQGLASALLNHALAHARDRGGVTIGFLAATVEGTHLYRSNGWTQLEDWPTLRVTGRGPSSCAE